MEIYGVSILARGITAVGPQGTVFANVDLRVEPGDLAVVSGSGGTGRTTMLLALSGRFPLTAGFLDVSGYVLPQQSTVVRELILPARLRPGFELDPRLRVNEVMTERRLLSKIDDYALEDAFELVDIDPHPQELVSELPAPEQLLLAVALAAAADPAGLVVDDVDTGLTAPDRRRVWAALQALTGIGTTVVASCTLPPSNDAVVAWLPEH